MKWEMCVDQSRLSDGILSIIGPESEAKEVQRLTTFDLRRLLESVRHGFQRWRVKSLVLNHIALSENPDIFRAFISRLLSLPTLTAIDFGSDRSGSPKLTESQVGILTEEVSEARYLKSLSINVINSGFTSRALGQMIADNKSLRSFSSNHRDDLFVHPVFFASIFDNTTLRSLVLRGVEPRPALCILMLISARVASRGHQNPLCIFLKNAKLRLSIFSERKAAAPEVDYQPLTKKRRF